MKTLETFQKAVGEMKEEAIAKVTELLHLVEELEKAHLANFLLSDDNFKTPLLQIMEKASPARAGGVPFWQPPAKGMTKEDIAELGTLAAKVPKATPAKGKGPKAKYDMNTLLEFLSEDKTVQEVMKKFGMSPITATKYLKALKKAGSVMTTGSRPVYWKKK